MESAPPPSPFRDEIATVARDRYTVEREIGRGGMATVYLAHDRRHNRKVALKVLNAELGAVIGVERFLAEIQITANLQHPNVLPLYDSGSGNGLLYYVMPYVEGESLRDRLNRERQLPIDEALRITTAVAAALDYAHRHGVVHRDLKPENILLQDGQPLVADFGIALAVTNAGGNRITQTGLSLGTPQYMSPEQATGERAIDARTDVYSLGCVLYEMLAGDPPHLGGSTQAVIAKLLTEKPARVRSVRDTVPAHVDYAVDRALAKVPADRWTTPREFTDALAGRTLVSDSPPVAAPGARGARVAAMALPWIIAGALAAYVLVKPAPSSTGSAALYVMQPGASPTDGFALTRDGSSLAYVGGKGGQRTLFVRLIDQLDGHPLPGTEGAQFPVWSPDGRRIAFASNGKVLRVARDGGAVDVMSTNRAFGHDWLDDEAMILGSSTAGTGLRIVDRAGAPLRGITKPNMASGEMFHAYPLALPNDRAAFVSWGPGGLEDDYLAIADLRTGKFVRSSLVALFPVALVDDWLLYTDGERRLMAVRYDAGAMTLGTEPVTLMDDVILASVSDRSALFYAAGRTTTLTRMTSGARSETRILTQDDGTIQAPRVSPDGNYIAYAMTRRDGSALGLLDLRAGTSTVLRTAPYLNDPGWTPNGKDLIYYEVGPDSGLWRMSVAQPANRSLLTQADFPRQPTVNPDGKSVLFMGNVLVRPQQRGYSLMEMGMEKGDSPRPLVAYRYEESQPAISPNGRWLANGSLETDHNEVYVRGFGANAGATRVRVSTDGGFEPRWSRDGRRLFYRTTELLGVDDRNKGQVIMAATLRETATTMEVVRRDSVASFVLSSPSDYDLSYDVGPGDVLYLAAMNSAASHLVYHENWLAVIRRRLAGGRVP
jgi:eukaryotic-like serine/threonine-protein kinase